MTGVSVTVTGSSVTVTPGAKLNITVSKGEQGPSGPPSGNLIGFFEVAGPTPQLLPAVPGMTKAFLTPLGGNAGALEYSTDTVNWQFVTAVLALETPLEISSVRLRTLNSAPIAVRLDPLTGV